MTAKPTVELYDVTLRDGAQGPGIKFSADDQLRIVAALDDMGIKYIEGGQPGSNPKAAELFIRARDMDLKHAQLAAFGSTRHSQSVVEDDANIKALLSAQTPVITIFAKTSPIHVAEILRVSLDENLKIIQESVSYLKSQGRRVFLDSEHYFDGYYEDAEYALTVLQCAWEAGAEVLCLCETNGGRMPWEVAAATQAARAKLPAEAVIGIHTHNDAGCAVANTVSAVHAGATHVQATVNGYGERTGNANLITIIPNLQLKMGLEVITPEQLRGLTRLSHVVAELANMTPRDNDPYVGHDAFTHKAGMHADAVRKLRASYEHVQPELVGNRRSLPVSEMSGRSSLLMKSAELGMALERDTPETREILNRVKELENEGYEFEGADASLELIIRKSTGKYRTFFTVCGFHVSVTQPTPDLPAMAEATVKVDLPDESRMHTAAEGHGPVDALNRALRKALEATYPELCDVHLDDYKVRILDAQSATGAKTRVLIESSDKETSWNTVGVSENIITASYVALLDSIEYKLLRERGHED